MSDRSSNNSDSRQQAGDTQASDLERLAGQTEQGQVASTTPENLVEVGGPAGPEPTRYGDWERKGRCIDF